MDDFGLKVIKYLAPIFEDNYFGFSWKYRKNKTGSIRIFNFGYHDWYNIEDAMNLLKALKKEGLLIDVRLKDNSFFSNKIEFWVPEISLREYIQEKEEDNLIKKVCNCLKQNEKRRIEL